MYACMHMHGTGKGSKRSVRLASQPLPQQHYSKSGTRNKVVAVVFVHVSKGPFVKLLTGTVVPEDGQLRHMPKPGTYKTLKGNTAAQRMTQQEYSDCLREALEYYYPPAEEEGQFRSRASVRAQHADWGRVVLVHDRLLPHGPEKLSLGDKGPVITCRKLPPRSCDLDPLDYGVFGTVKTATRRDFPLHDDWDSESAAFLKGLQDFKTKKLVEAFKTRLKKCLARGGKHVEGIAID